MRTVLCAQTKRKLEQFQTPGQLIGATGATAGAIDATETLDGLIDGHTFDKGTHALGVTAAAANELNRLNDVTLDSNSDLLGADISAGFENYSPDTVNSVVTDDADAEILLGRSLVLILILGEKIKRSQNRNEQCDELFHYNKNLIFNNS